MWCLMNCISPKDHRHVDKKLIMRALSYNAQDSDIISCCARKTNDIKAITVNVVWDMIYRMED